MGGLRHPEIAYMSWGACEEVPFERGRPWQDPHIQNANTCSSLGHVTTRVLGHA